MGGQGNLIYKDLTEADQDLKNERVRWATFVFLFVVLVALDKLAKKYSHNIFKNQNFAFSLPLPVWLMYLIYALVLSGLVYYAAKNYHRLNFLSSAALTLIFAGALSNITERLMLGYVRDFIYIYFYHWAGIYNLADGYIILGIILLLWNEGDKIDKIGHT